MQALQSQNLIPFEDGMMHMVKLPSGSSIPTWLVHAQIELDGKRVFVRMVDTATVSGRSSDSGMVGLVVSPVY
jgi:hypothetical protein